MVRDDRSVIFAINLHARFNASDAITPYLLEVNAASEHSSSERDRRTTTKMRRQSDVFFGERESGQDVRQTNGAWSDGARGKTTDDA